MAGWGGGVPVTLPLGGGLKVWLLGLNTRRLTDGVRLDFDLCMPAGLRGLESRDDKLPVEVAAFKRWTSGFSGTGRGILDIHGMSGEGGW